MVWILDFFACSELSGIIRTVSTPLVTSISYVTVTR